MGAAYVARNLLINAVSPAARPFRLHRQPRGIDDRPDLVEDALQGLQPGIEALGGIRDRDVLELGSGRTRELLRRMIADGARSGTGIDPYLAVKDGAPARFMRFDGRNIPLPDESIDRVVSKSVLEHVAPRDVEPLMTDMFRVLRPGGGAVHIIDLRDHMFVQGDDVITGDWLDALRYPEFLYRAMFSRRSAAINRLREPEWRALFDRLRFEILAWQVTRYPLPPGFERKRLAPRFREFPLEVLSIGFLTVTVRRRGDTQRLARPPLKAEPPTPA